MSGMGRFYDLGEDAASDALPTWCASQGWAQQVSNARPFPEAVHR